VTTIGELKAMGLYEKYKNFEFNILFYTKDKDEDRITLTNDEIIELGLNKYISTEKLTNLGFKNRLLKLKKL